MQHHHDKARAEARRETEWVAVSASPRPSIHRNFGDLEAYEYRYENEEWKRCDGPNDYGSWLKREAKRRARYTSKTSRKGVAVTMTRTDESPIKILVVSMSPWGSDCFADQFASGIDPRPQLWEIQRRWLAEVMKLFAGRRYVLAFALHCDTDDLHWDIAVSRQDGEGGRIGEAGLNLVGPWCVGTNRQVRAGAKISAEKRTQLERAVANFERRHGSSQIPLDVSLALALDKATESVFGEEQIRPYREAYARRVPEFERLHKEAQLTALRAAEQRLQDNLTPEASTDGGFSLS